MSISLSPQVTNIYVRNCLSDSTTSYQKTMEQLSSGVKFTSMGDDPIGMTTAANLDVEINFNKRVQTNVDLGNDMLSMAEGYQEDILNNVQRIRDLTVQACNQSYTDDDKNAILNEIQARLDYIDLTADSANFNSKNVLDGSSLDCTLKIGPSTTDVVNIGETFIDCHTDTLGIDITGTMTEQDWSDYLDSLDTAFETITANISKIGAFVNRLNLVSDNLANTNTNLAQYQSNITDTDVAETSADMVKYQILQQASSTIFVQTNQINQMVYSLFKA